LSESERDGVSVSCDGTGEEKGRVTRMEEDLIERRDKVLLLAARSPLRGERSVAVNAVTVKVVTYNSNTCSFYLEISNGGS
jgi:hypothetical protein